MTAWDESFALDMQRRINRHQPVSDEDADRFHAMVTAAVDTANTQHAGTEPERHPWTAQQAHDVYTRINRDPGSVTDLEADDFAAWAAEQGQPTLPRGEVPRFPARTPRSRSRTSTSRPPAWPARRQTPPPWPPSTSRSARRPSASASCCFPGRGLPRGAYVATQDHHGC